MFKLWGEIGRKESSDAYSNWINDFVEKAGDSFLNEYSKETVMKLKSSAEPNRFHKQKMTTVHLSSAEKPNTSKKKLATSNSPAPVSKIPARMNSLGRNFYSAQQDSHALDSTGPATKVRFVNTVEYPHVNASARLKFP